MTETTRRIQQLPIEKQRLLLERLRERQPKVQRDAELPAIVPAPEDRYLPFPLTDMQQAYWIGRQGAFTLGNVATHVYHEFEVPGLDIDRLNAAFQGLIERHDTLRAIVLPDGQQQVLAEVLPYTIVAHDLRDRPPEEVAAWFDQIRQQMSHQVLRPDQWPLFDIQATRLDAGHTRLHISIDGLLLDGWSTQILFREWFYLYEHPQERLPSLELSFRDYVCAEHALQQTDLYQRSLAYWRDRLANLPPAPQLPLAKSPAALTTPRFARREARLDAPAWQRLKDRIAQAGLTPTSLLLAAYGEVLGRWSKSPRFTLNVPRFNRLPLHPQVNSILGEFASFTLLEVDVSAAEPFVVRAKRLQDQLWKDLDHSLVSGVQILRELSKVQGWTAEGAMPVVFTNAPQDIRGMDSRLALPIEDRGDVVFGITQTSQVWLDHEFFEVAGELVLHWDAVEDLFPAGLLDDMFETYRRLLTTLADSDAGWQEIRPIVLPAAQRALLAAVNGLEALIPPVLLHELFAQQAAEHPDHPAIITMARTLTYREVAQRAILLAGQLRQSGARPNTLVAVIMEKGWEQAVAVLGILQAGAAYLPIDPALPPARRAYLLDHGQVSLVVTQSWLEHQLELPGQIQCFCVDTAEPGPDDRAPLDSIQGHDDLAYVLYTSGSTGVPKGVMIAHAGVVNAVLETNRAFEIGRQDRVLGLTALHHDMSVYDLFGCFAAGATLVLPDAGATRDPRQWAALIAREQITIWNSVPAMMEMLLEHAAHRRLRLDSLRLVILGGDWIAVGLPDRLRALAADVQLVSVGGPTETSVWNIWYRVGHVDPDWRSIPYGKPIANTRYYVLNDLLEDCPLWTPGQLYCAGAGLARGYWRDEDKTCASFIAHPRTGERLYHTGDIGRYLPDGNIEFLGREDFQVKIQGQRIELGEIEAILAQHPFVHTAVVTPSDDQQGSRHLAGYVTLRSAQEQKTGHLIDFLEDADQEYQLDDVLLDPSQRVEFKLRQHGLRRDLGAAPFIQLDPLDWDVAAFARRRSYRKFRPEPIELRQVNRLLGCLAQIQLDGSPLPKYRYPSGGGLYPVQCYLFVKPGRVAGLAGGTYYYHPKEHRLLLLSAGMAMERELHAPANRAIFDESGFSLFLVGDLDAIEPLYGALSRDLCLLEAGYIGQLLMEASPDLALGLCPMGALNAKSAQAALGLSDRQIVLHGLFGGAITPAQTRPEAFLEEMALTAASAAPAAQAQDAGALAGELQAFLRERLPGHMVPAMIQILDALPLNPNGKIDRKALSEQAIPAQARTTNYVAPRNEIEGALVQIWQTILQAERVGIHDNFFDLGGNSLHVIQVHTKVQELFHKDVPIMAMFNNPTISYLADYLSREQDETDEPFDDMQERARKQKQSMTRKRPLQSARELIDE